MNPNPTPKQALELLIQTAAAFTDRDKAVALQILNGSTPGSIATDRAHPDVITLHDAFRAAVTCMPIPLVPPLPPLSVLRQAYRPASIVDRYVALCTDGTTVVGGLLDEGYRLGLVRDLAEEAYRLHLSHLLAHYAVNYTVSNIPPERTVTFSYLVNILNPPDLGPQWDVVVAWCLPGFTTANDQAKQLILLNLFDPAGLRSKESRPT